MYIQKNKITLLLLLLKQINKKLLQLYVIYLSLFLPISLHILYQRYTKYINFNFHCLYIRVSIVLLHVFLFHQNNKNIVCILKQIKLHYYYYYYYGSFTKFSKC